MLKHECFQVDANSVSLDLKTIEGVESPPSWWSPKTENATAPAADLAVLRECHKRGAMHLLDNAWLGAIGQISHKVCIWVACATFPQVWWYVPFHHFPGSGVVAWPVALSKFGGGRNSVTILEFDLGLQRVVVLPILSLEGVRGFSWAWRSNAWLRLRLPASAQASAMGIRAVASSAEEPILHVVAKAAWFAFDAAMIKRLRAHAGHPLACGNALLEVLVEATAAILEVSEEAALDICYKRIAHLKGMASFSSHLLQVDEAAEVMDRNDVRAFHNQQKQASERAAELKSLARDYVARRSRVSASGSSAPSRRGARPVAARKKGLPTTLPADLSKIKHSDIKKFVPEDGRVWKSNHSQAWIGHVPPNATVSRAWRRYGETESLRLILVAVWQQHCDLHGLSYRDCPLQGVLGSTSAIEEAAQPSASGAASSSVS